MVAGMALFISEILFLGAIKAWRTFSKLFGFQVVPQKEITSLYIGQTGWPRNVAIAIDNAMLKYGF